MTDVHYDPQTALIVVDVQNDFADPAGSLYVRGGEQIPERVNAEVAAAAAAGAQVVYTQDWHPAETPHFAKDGGTWPAHCVADSWGAAFHPALTVLPGVEVVQKGVGGEDGYSAFTVRHPRSGIEDATGLSEVLMKYDIRRVVVVGLATDYCVRNTAIDAMREGFKAVVLRDAIAAVDVELGDGERALQAMIAAGVQVL